MKKYVIPIVVKYWQDNWFQQNQTCIAIKQESITKDDVSKLIEGHLRKVENEDYIEIAFSGIDTEQKEELLEVAYEYLKEKKIDSIKVTTRPDCINKKFLKMLKKYKIKTIELEVGSANDYILKALNIDYSVSEIKKASKAIRWNGFKLGFQIFVGLPESTKIDDVNTVKTLLKMKPKEINITPVLVIKNTPLEKELKDRIYKPLTIVQAVETCKEMVKILNEQGIETIAIGYGILDNDIEQLEIAEEVIDGPFQPSFRNLVESGLWYDAILNKIKKLNMKVSQVEVTVNPIDVNNVIGYKQENINNLKETYDVELIITPDEEIKPGKSKIEIVEKT